MSGAAQGLRFHPAHLYAALKSATRGLIRATGGLENARAVTRVSVPHIARYGDVKDMTAFMPIDVVLDIEAALGEPIITRELARLQGHVLLSLPAVQGDDGPWGKEIGEIARECGDVLSAAGTAFAQGGVITADEIRTLNIVGQVNEAIEALVAFRAACEQELTKNDRPPVREPQS